MKISVECVACCYKCRKLNCEKKSVSVLFFFSKINCYIQSCILRHLIKKPYNDVFGNVFFSLIRNFLKVFMRAEIWYSVYAHIKLQHVRVKFLLILYFWILYSHTFNIKFTCCTQCLSESCVIQIYISENFRVQSIFKNASTHYTRYNMLI